MILKSMRIKATDAFSVTDYIARNTRNREGIKGLVSYIQKDFDLEVLHNLTQGSPKEISEQFERNLKFKRSKQKVLYYHEVLSFRGSQEGGKADKVTPQELKQIVEHYISIRCPRALVFGRSHHDSDNLHVHLLISGNEICSHKTLRLDNQRFYGVRRQLDEFLSQFEGVQKENLKYIGKARTNERGKAAQKDREFQAKGKEPKQTRKNELREKMVEAIKQDLTLEDLAKQGILPYSHNGRCVGIMYKGRKYRFTTLGLDTIMDRYDQLQRTEELWKTRFNEQSK